jgi:hypothetical protein
MWKGFDRAERTIEAGYEDPRSVTDELLDDRAAELAEEYLPAALADVWSWRGEGFDPDAVRQEAEDLALDRAYAKAIEEFQTLEAAAQSEADQDAAEGF